MQNKNANTNVTVGSDNGGLQQEPTLSSFDVALAPDNEPDALSLEPEPLEGEQESLNRTRPSRKGLFRRLSLRLDIAIIVVLLAVMGGLVFAANRRHKQQQSNANVATQYGTQSIPLNGFIANEQGVNFGSSSVVINGPLTANNGLVVTPSVQPSAPKTGQFYYDQNTNQMAYYNGTAFVPLTGQTAVVQSLGGVTGQITLGGGLSIVGNQLSANTPAPSGVLSVGGQTGDIAIGSGLKMNGNTLQNGGVLSVVSGTPGLSVANDGNGNLTITTSGAGSGTVTSSGGTAGILPLFTGAQDIENSAVSQSGGTVTVGANLNVTGAVGLSSPLSMASGGTGAASITANGVAVSNGSALSGVTAGSPGLCLLSTAGAPAFQACPVGGVTSLNGLTGGLTIANATGSVNTITINDATTVSKGIASFNSSNFSISSGAVNTIQNISTSATPTFAGVNTNNITPTGALSIGSAGQTLSLLGNASSLFQVTGGGQTTTVGFTGVPSGNVTYNFDRSAAAGPYTICTTAGNCGTGSGSVTTVGGTTNRLSKFTGAQAIGDSSVSDTGSSVTILGSANLTVQGGTATIGTLSQAGSLVLNDGTGHTATISISGQAVSHVYNIPDVGADATFCLSTGNCIGGGGSGGAAPNDAAYLVASLNGTLSSERVLTGGNNITTTDGGPNGNLTVATVQNPTFTTSVTTPSLQSGGALTISSAAGQTVSVSAGTTIELQSATNVTGNLGVSGGISGGSNAFVVSAGGAVTAATGITSSGTITFSGLNCTGNANGGALTTDNTGKLMCSDDDGGSGSAITGSGSANTIAMFNGSQTITNSIITQSGSTVTITGSLAITNALTVANGGTGAASFTSNGVLYGNGSNPLQVTAAGTSGQVLVANGSGVPTFVSVSGDITLSNAGVVTIQPDAVALGTDTTGNYAVGVTAGTGISVTGSPAEGWSPTIAVLYGSTATTAVQGNTSITVTAGTNLTGGGSITLGTGGTVTVNVANSPTFSGTLAVQGATATIGTSSQQGSVVLNDGAGKAGTLQTATLAQNTAYTLPDPGSTTATICLTTGNCAGAGTGVTTAGGTVNRLSKFTGSQAIGNSSISDNAGLVTLNGSTNLVIQGGTATLGTTSQAGTLQISDGSSNTVSIVSASLSADRTYTLPDAGGNATLCVDSGNCIGGTGAAPNGANYLVTSLDSTLTNERAVANGTNITLTDGGANGNFTVATVNNPIFSTSVTSPQLILSGAGSNGTLVVANLGQSTTYTLPDPGAGTATICLSTGNCAGSGTGVTTAGGTVNRLSKFTGSQAIGNSLLSDNGSTVAVTGTADFVVQGGTATLGTLSQGGTLNVMDGGGNTVSIVSASLGGNRTYTLPDAGGPADFCLSTGNCIGSGGGGAPNNATYLVTSLNGSLSNERAITNGTNIALTDGGANGNFTIATVNNPTFSTSVTTPSLVLTGAGSNGSIAVANLGQTTTYTLPDPGAGTANICLSTGNCSTAGSAGGDLTGTYPNPTIAKLQGGTLTITSVASGNILQYNGSAWVNQSLSGDVTLNSSGVATIATGAVTSGKILDGTIANVDLSTGSFGNITGVGTLTSLSVQGAANINTAGTANTAIGNGTGTFQLTSNGGLNVSTVGALTGVSGITTNGAYTQSGSGANAFTGASTFSAAGTALTVTNTASIGTVSTNNITPTGALTVGDPGQNFTIQGTSASTITATNGGNTTTVDFTTPVASTTIHIPALSSGNYTLCTSSGNCAGVGATLQTAYNNSSNPEIVLNGTNGALTVRDNSSPLGANLLEVQNNGGTTTYFGVTASGISTTGTETASSDINTTGGTIKTNSTSRINNNGDLVNIGAITAAGIAQINTSGSATTQIGNSGSGGTLSLQSASTIAITTSNFNVSTAGVVTLAGAQSSDITTAANGAASATAITIQPGSSGGASSNGAALNLTGGIATGTTSVTAGTVTIQGGNATGASGTRNGGGVTLDGGTGATANGSINIGTNIGGNSINIGGTSAASPINSGTQTVNVGINNTVGSTTNVVIGAGTGATGGTTTLRAKTTIQLTSGNTTSINSAASTTSSTGAITIKSGDASSGSNLSGGTVTVDTGTHTGAGVGIVNIGNANATSVQIGNGSTTTTVTGVLQASGGTISINDSSNNITNINTGSSTGAVNIGNSLSGTLTLQGGSSSTIVINNGANKTTLNFTAPSGTNTITFPAASGTVQLAPSSGNFVQTVPGTTLTNTISPTANTVVGLTVNGTTGTATTATIINQTGTADALAVNATQASGTTPNGINVTQSGAGTLGSGVSINRSSGTLNNGLSFSGTIGTDINRATGTLTIQGGSGVQLNSNTTVAATSTSAFLAQNSGATATALSADTSNSRVGIGTAAPTRTLDVSVNNATVNAMPILIEQAGTGDSGIEYKTTSKNFYSGIDNTDGVFKISSSYAANGTITQGENNIADTGDDNNAAATQASKLVASTTGTVSTISVYINSVGTSAGAQLGIYADNGSGTLPTTLIASTSTFTAVTGWNTVTLSGVSITSGTTYWLALSTQGFTHFKYKVAGGATAYDIGGAYPMPGTFTSTTGNATDLIDIYLTVVSTGTTDEFNGTPLFRLSETGQTVFQNAANSTSAFQIQNSSGTSMINLDTSNEILTVGPSGGDSTGPIVVLGTKTTGGDPTGQNGAIYYNASNKLFRCYQNSTWKNCLGMSDVSDRRWGYLNLGSTTSTAFVNLGTAARALTGTPANSKQAESVYISYPDAGTSNSDAGAIGGTGPVFTDTEPRYLPRMATRIRVDASAINGGTRYWVGMFKSTPMGFDPPTTTAANTDTFIGVGYRDGVNSGKWLCASSDGTNSSGTDTGVTVTLNHYYDIIVDESLAGTVTCSIADNGGSFVTVSNTNNVPSTSDDLGMVAAVRSVNAVSRSISIEYMYYDYK